MQDVFVRLVQQHARLEDRGTSSLLYQMATQVSLNHLRSARRRPQTREEELLQQIASAHDWEGQSMAGLALARLLGREPASTRVIATLLYVDRMTLEEVAAEMGMSVSGVRKRLRVLKERLKGLEVVDEQA